MLGLAAGYEDLNDHNTLRRDPLFALAANKSDPLGLDRRCEQDKGNALASASTLNRLELGNNKTTRAHKIQADHAQIEALLIRKGVGTLDKKTREVVIDLDATDDPFMAARKGDSFMAITATIVTCPSMLSSAKCPFGPSCALARTMPARVRCVPWRPSSPRFAGAARTPGSSCGGTAVFAAKR